MAGNPAMGVATAVAWSPVILAASVERACLHPTGIPEGE
jgi:hypothetical protein